MTNFDNIIIHNKIPISAHSANMFLASPKHRKLKSSLFSLFKTRPANNLKIAKKSPENVQKMTIFK
jgi:hypothetical protein